MEDDVRLIKEVATAELKNSQDVNKVNGAAQLLKLAAEIENQRAQAQKTEGELRDLRAHKKTRDTKEFIALLAPVFTTLVLAGTLALQTYQFSRTERDKYQEAQQQREAAAVQAKKQADAAEDASWADALKLLSSSEKLSPAAVLLKRFSLSPRYSGEARRTGLDLLSAKSTDPAAFQSLFAALFEPASWNNLAEIVQINRQLNQRINPLLLKAWDAKKYTPHLEKLTKSEREQYDAWTSNLEYMSRVVALVFKSPGRPSNPLDLHGVAIWDTDLKGVDLQGADISSTNFSTVNLEGANLSRITKFEYCAFWSTPWWEAAKISPELLDYLKQNHPLVEGVTYQGGRKFKQAEYDKAISNLQH